MPKDTPTAILRHDYAPPAHLVDQVSLDIDIREPKVTVTARLAMHPQSQGPLRLHGEALETVSVKLDGADAAWRIADGQLLIDDVPDRPFTLETVVTIDPYGNQALQGLYRSGDILCTQCEAEGFRRITWYPDRPDVMTRYRVAISADRSRYPVLLSNGNLIEESDLGDGRHRAVWDDPFPKPSYLFAVVAGDLALVEDHFTTRSGRRVALRVWVEHGNEDQVPHAMRSLKKAMAWDEQVYGLEYDLDVYNIVAVSHFNMGAMENKSLNVFNSKYVLARRDTATDADFLGVESVIAHEYFHNWTGNRVTCRDWFQLTLKEGLTVFRDQEFSADMHSRGLKRIEDVRGLRAAQFPEDNGPMAHPIRPDSYVEINNFYTATVYQKGAEVIRMIHTLIGADAFRRGMDLYFERHDGQAVTCEDFVVAMEDASGADLTQFRRWYEQAGTPRLKASWRHDPQAATLTLTLEQSSLPSPGQPDKKPFHIPVAVGLVSRTGGDVPLRLEGENDAQGTTRVLSLTEPVQDFVFADVDQPAVPSLLRGFSAPVILEAPYSPQDRAFLMGRDSDAFTRWDAGQQLAGNVLLDLARRHRACEPLPLDEAFAEAWGQLLAGSAADPAFAAEALSLPSFTEIAERMEVIDVEGLHAARKALFKGLAERHNDLLTSVRLAQADAASAEDASGIAARRLRNLALNMLAHAGGSTVQADAEAQFASATNMTDQLAALGALTILGPQAAEPALARFLEQWRNEKLVVNKWLAVQAMADWPDLVERVRALLDHPIFDSSEPNKVYALLGGLGANQPHFHRADGAGYALMAEQVLGYDGTNPQVASRLVRTLMRWKRYDPERQTLMRAALERIQAKQGLSPDVAEIVTKALG